MKIYFAGSESSKYGDILREAGATKKLITYANYYNREDKYKKTADVYKGFDIFMDCGAFSAWQQGFEIDVDKYGKFIKDYESVINVYPNLDVKGDIKKTINNQKILEDRWGLSPIPVFHVITQRWDILEEYIDKYEYIALGAIAGEEMTKDSLYRVLDNVFSRAKRSPVTKFHGFGLTIWEVLKRYPFYSVDSTSWLAPVIYGQGLVKGDLMQQMKVKKREHAGALIPTIKNTLLKEKEITDLWAMRGIKF